jgi:rubredoxin
MTNITEKCPNCGDEDEQVYNIANDFYSCQMCGSIYDTEEIELPDGTIESR